MKTFFAFVILLLFPILGYNQTDSLEIVSYNLSECISGDWCNSESNYRITDSKFNTGTTIIRIRGMANCSGIQNIQITNVNKEVFINFEGGEDVEYSDTIGFTLENNTQDTVFLIDRVSISSASECDCYYDFNFKVLGLESNKMYHYYINGKIVLEPIPRELIIKDSLDKDTVRRLISEIEEVKYHKCEVRYEICKIISKQEVGDYYYQVKVFELGRYKTSFEFNIYPKSDYRIVYHYGFLELSFEEWRKYREYPQWDEFWDMMDIIRKDRNEK